MDSFGTGEESNIEVLRSHWGETRNEVKGVALGAVPCMRYFVLLSHSQGICLPSPSGPLMYLGTVRRSVHYLFPLGTCREKDLKTACFGHLVL